MHNKFNKKILIIIIAVALSLVMAGFTYAWMSQRAAMTTLITIQPPDTIAIIPTTKNVEELKLLDLDFNEETDTKDEDGKIHIFRPVCIRSTEQMHRLEVVHTTNLNDLDFKIYPASREIKGENGYELSYVTDTILNGKYRNKKDSDKLAKEETLENYKQTSDVADKHAYPLYWVGVTCTNENKSGDGYQTVISYTEDGADQSTYYNTYYILEISWKETSKETDLFYIMAQNMAE